MKTSIAAEKLASIVSAAGLTSTAQAGFIKVHGPAGYDVYVAATKNVSRVDLAGFEFATCLGVTNLGSKSFGRVKQQLDFTQPEAQVLATFALVLDFMKALAPVENAAKPAKAPRAPKAAKVAAPSAPEVFFGCMTEAQATALVKAARLATIEAAHHRMLVRKAADMMSARPPEMTDFSIITDAELDEMAPLIGVDDPAYEMAQA